MVINPLNSTYQVARWVDQVGGWVVIGSQSRCLHVGYPLFCGGLLTLLCDALVWVVICTRLLAVCDFMFHSLRVEE